MRRLLLLVALAACSSREPGDPDAAGLPDAARDPDAASLPDADLTDAALPPLTGDILARLQMIPGMTVTERTDLVPPALNGYRYFYLTYVQQVDQLHAGGPTFTQRLTLLHRADDAPVVVQGGGYHLAAAPTPSRAEPTRLLEANQLSIEHRYFTPSRPIPTDWSELTIRQSAADYHRIIQAGHRLYPGSRFLVTGASKGGETAVFHRRFYPGDVDGTVAYVAPLVLGAPDARFLTFVEDVGPEDCRTKLTAFRRQALSGWRDELAMMLGDLAPGATYDQLGLDRALEHALLELPFALWQYGKVAACDDIPAIDDTAQAAYDFIDAHSGWSSFSDATLERYGPYYYQASVELGYPAIGEAEVADLLVYPGTDIGPVYAPPDVRLEFDPLAMPDIQTWVKSEGNTLLFVYGANDPWSAAAFDITGATDTLLFFVEDGNHGANIAQLAEPAKSQATAAVLRWGGVTAKRPPSFGRPGEAPIEVPRRPR
jgi:PS-10 peptidase S37